ncbi:MAG: GGDEF domain-containing protein [Spirochaetales bacterium]|nr:GGDEF domain-containing protein [Spirochaetales bacterium]
MIKKNLYILLDNLSEFEDIFTRLKQDAPFVVDIITFDDFKSDKYKAIFQELDFGNLFISVDESVYTNNKKEIHEYMRSIYNHLFSNFLILSSAPDFIQDDDIVLGKKHCFYIHKDADIQVLAHNLILYMFKLFNETVLSTRLLDYITHSFDHIVTSELLRKKKDEIELLNKELEWKNKTDSLTNLYNRQAMFDFLDVESKRTIRDLWRISNAIQEKQAEQLKEVRERFENVPVGEILDHIGVYTVMMLDVDHFKKINDTYGHLVGDQVLKVIGELLRDNTIFRESDILGRFGGEEFIGIFPSTNVNNAIGPAQRFTRALKEHLFKGPAGEEFHVTVSVGISEFHPGDQTKEEVIHRADKALYWVKEHGRDQIAVYEKIF